MRSTVRVLAAILVGASAILAAGQDRMAANVTSLVNQATNAKTETDAFKALESLGAAGVPYIVAHLGDVRPLPVQAMSLENKSPKAFESLRHYGPKVVHDALSAILNQITGESFEFVYNGASVEARQRDSKAWRAWCAKKYPQQATICEGGI
jgi:hypothetical protein